MVKETSSRVSSIAARIMHMAPRTVGDAPEEFFNELLADAKSLAASCMSQDETPGSEPETFLHRLKRERAQLSGKLDALTLFLSRGASGITTTQRHLLDSQQAAMSLYLKTLDLRLEDLALQPRSIEDRVASATMPELGEPAEINGFNEDRDGPVPFDR